VAEADPDRTAFGNLPHPPFTVNLHKGLKKGTLKIEGYLGGKKVVEKLYAHEGFDRQFLLAADDAKLMADGADSTRVTMLVADEYGNLRRYSTAAVSLSLEGPAELIGETPFSLFGGCGAVWIRAKHEPGTAVLKATHPVLGTKEVRITLEAAQPERV